ncbi:uncharacterized protein LOC134546321 isoform X2 [Bacillus rossius redtenbacheri]|uniref:uncharacterized protein LOC134546321 isoform X2 n=1 Tax=Bacillus rossius redtenbacheri TaxID=93214 RepID=UPI002FDEDC3E
MASTAQKCRFCPATFTAGNSRYHHERQCADNMQRDLQQCHLCGKMVARSDKMQQHLSTCAGAVATTSGMRCSLCYKVFARADFARRHEKSACGLNPNRIAHTCDNCAKEFARADKLKAHIKMLKGPAPPPTKKQRMVAVKPAVLPKPSTSRTKVVTGMGLANTHGFITAEVGFKGNLKTYIAVNTSSSAKDICTYLNSIKDKIINQLVEKIEENGPLKFNNVLECDYEKPVDTSEDKRAFKTMNAPLYAVHEVEKVVTESISKICKEEEDYMGKGSGWTLSAVKRLQLRINNLDPLCDSSYIELPACIVTKHAVINPQNFEDHMCFKWSILVKYVEGVHPERVNQRYHDLEEKFNFNNIEFPTPIKQIPLFEKQPWSLN